MRCPLCRADEVDELPRGRDGRGYGRCRACDLHFLRPEQRLDATGERARYDLHRADHFDDGYLRFVTPLVDAIEARVPRGGRGLDFGAGREPVLARHLGARGYGMAIYDAFYWPEACVLENRYDFVVACEVIEHLFEPAREFGRLRDRLVPGGSLFVMTDPRRDEVDFDAWYYRRDPTHVAFYSERTFRWIARAFGFKHEKVNRRVVCFTTPEET